MSPESDDADPPPEERKDYTLLTVMGERPQVMTELIWALAQKEDRYPARIIVLTTTRGRRALRAQLLGDPAYHDANNRKDRWTPFCREVLHLDEPLALDEIEVPKHTDGTEIEDIYDPDDGRLFENWCFDLVHSLTRDIGGRPLYGCIAGGRKTMGQDVTTAFTLYARRHDRLYHVIVPKHVEKDKTFFWPRAREGHAHHAGDVHPVNKSFPHLRARLEDGLLSEISDVDEHSHYQELLDELDPDRRALAKPKAVTLRLQRKVTDAGTQVSGVFDCKLSISDAQGLQLGSISLSPLLVATWLVVMNHLWRPGERAVTSKSQLLKEKIDEQRRIVLGAFGYDMGPHGDVKPWVKPDYWGNKKKYPSYYSDHISKLNKDPFKEKPAAEPLFARYFKVIRPAVTEEIKASGLEGPYYFALPSPLPEGIELRIEVSSPRVLADENHWPFEHMPLPVEVSAT